jgi:RNA polymerase sigma-70 factor (ECF subfamily)
LVGWRRKILAIPADPHDVTALLLAWRAGDEGALERIVPRVHGELQKIARRCMRGERPDHSLQPTALLNEAYLRLVDVRRVNWQNRTHFLAMSARIMRRVLVEAARARRYRRRGADACRVTLAEDLMVSEPPDVDIIALSEALDEFAQIDQRKSRVVELRYFGGLTVEETAEALGISAETVARDWRIARAWLRRELGGR